MKKEFLNTREKRNIAFLFTMAIFAVICFVKFFDRNINAQDTTVFAFSYKYGFISRGLMGTFWWILDEILPMNLMDFSSIYKFTLMITVIWYMVLFWFYYICLKNCNEKDEKNMKYLICFLSVFAFPFFATVQNFGRLDEYLMILTVVACVLIVKEKHEWLIVPIVTICMIMHHGYVFMYLNIILVLFFYKILMNEEKRKKYIVLFTSTFLIASVFFLYFEFFSHPEGEGIYEEIVTLAKSLSRSGNSFSESMVNHEILGLDVYDDEKIFHTINAIETPIAFCFYFPYLFIGLGFLVRLFRGKSVKEKWAYLAVAVGSLTLIPQIVLKVDLGRYMFAAFFYYIAIVMCLIAMKDKHVIAQLEDSISRVKNTIPAGKLLIAYPMMLMPFLDVPICWRFWELIDKFIYDLSPLV